MTPLRHFLAAVAALLLIAALGVIGFTFVVQGELRSTLKGRRLDRQILQLSGHYTLCGCGTVGRQSGTHLRELAAPTT